MRQHRRHAAYFIVRSRTFVCTKKRNTGTAANCVVFLPFSVGSTRSPSIFGTPTGVPRVGVLLIQRACPSGHSLKESSDASGPALGRRLAGQHAEVRGHFGRDHFHRGRRFGFGGGYDDWCYEYPYYTPNCYLYGY